ncbi:MAG TPA: hypothetical protein PLV32_11875 [Chitinophagaceae bacterium]|nr:hypothetical protein [Chitinophagaceae bacterium]
MNLKFQYKSLVEGLKLLASSYEDQKSYLPDFVNLKDEVIAIFGDAFLLMPQLIEQDFLSKNAIASILRCFNWMELTTRNEDISDLESFKNHESWQKVRELAMEALEDMNEEKGKPDLSHINWID